MGIFYRACLFVVVILLASAGAAAAECAWVLWEQQIYSSKDRTRELFDVAGAYDTLADCKVFQAKLLNPDSAWASRPGKRLPGGWEDGFMWVDSDSGLTVTKRAMCLPAATDPRGLKTR